MKTAQNLLTLAVLLAFTGTAQAALVDRGGGLIYDTDLNITWLANANANGLMTWSQANTWASNLSYYDSVRNQTLTGWRLPTTGPINGTSFNYLGTNNGSTDIGYNISAQGTNYAGSTASEMAYLFYNSLNNIGACNPAQSLAFLCGGYLTTSYGLLNTSTFSNFNPAYYWSGTELEGAYAANAFYFDFSNGLQTGSNKSGYSYALAVRPGDVAPVPAPMAAWLLGSGLLGLIGVARRKTA